MINALILDLNFPGDFYIQRVLPIENDIYIYILHNHICPYIGNYLLTKIAIVNIEKFIIAQMKREISNSTINQYFSVLKIVYNKAYRIYYIEKILYKI